MDPRILESLNPWILGSLDLPRIIRRLLLLDYGAPISQSLLVIGLAGAFVEATLALEDGLRLLANRNGSSGQTNPPSNGEQKCSDPVPVFPRIALSRSQTLSHPGLSHSLITLIAPLSVQRSRDSTPSLLSRPVPSLSRPPKRQKGQYKENHPSLNNILHQTTLPAHAYWNEPTSHPIQPYKQFSV